MEPGLLVSKYRLASLLGKGGFGEVWKAFDTELQRWVALKFLLGGHEVARFHREAQLAGNLSHPNIAAIYDIGSSESGWYIAMQFVEGQTLKTYPQRDPRTLVRLLRDAARAVAYAHQHGVIHRDLKPDNLMVQEDRLFVMDFGLARQVDTNKSLSNVVVGTPAYMAPEQARGEIATAQADVWSLGATLYELLTRRQPFAGENVLQLILNLQDTEPILPHRLNQAIDADLETIVLKCLEKNPARRYDGATELANELDRWLRGDPIEARAVSTIERILRRVRRNKALSAAIAAAVVILLSAGVLFLAQRQKTREALAATNRAALEREARLKRLSSLWTAIIERKQELRRLLSPVEKSRPALEAAIAAIDSYIEEAPGEPQGWYVRARGRLYLADLERAEQDARNAVELAPDFRPGWTLLGMVLIEKYADARYGDQLSQTERLRDAQPILNAALAAFGRGWRPEDVRAETARWGLAWTREDDVQERLARAHQLRYAGQLADATRLLETALEEYRSEDYLLFLNRHREAIELAPGFAEALVDRGTLRSADKKFDAAIADYTEALRLRPGFVRALNNRGNARRLKGDLNGAIADYSEAIRCDPGYARAFSNRANVRTVRGEYDAAIADATEAIRLDPTDVRALQNRARAKRLRGDFDGAIADFTEAIRLRPDYAEAYNGRGLAREERKDRDGALADFNESIRLRADSPETFFNRGNVQLRMGAFDGAIADYSAAIHLRPEFVTAFINRGNARQERDVKAAMADYNEAVRLAPALPEAYFARATLKERLKELDGALADYSESARLRPDHAPSFVCCGVIKFAQGKVDAAIEDFLRAIRLKPENPDAHFHLGNAKERKGDDAGAIAEYSEAIRYRAAHPQAFHNRGLLRRRKGDLEGAIADYSEAIRLRPVYPDALYNRALSWRALGEVTKAVADLEKALEVAPETWAKREAAGKLLKELKQG